MRTFLLTFAVLVGLPTYVFLVLKLHQWRLQLERKQSESISLRLTTNQNGKGRE